MRRHAARLMLSVLEDRTTPAVMNFSLGTGSSLMLGGTLDGNAITQQGAGSLSATYTGTVAVDVDFGSSTLAFLTAGSSMKAGTSGPWAPQVGGGTLGFPGTALANYGALVNVSGLDTKAAIRGLIGVFSSGPLPLTGGPTYTLPSGQSLTITAGSVDYYNLLLRGNSSLVNSGGSNNTPSNATFTDLGNGKYSLAMPCAAVINDTVSGLPLILTINGNLNGSVTLPVVDLNGASAGFDSTFTHTAGAAASKIAPAATVTHASATTLTSMTVTLSAVPDGAAESLSASLTGTGLTSPGYDPLTGQIVITGVAALSTYQSVLRNITYANSNIAGTPGPRPVTVTVTDATNTSLMRTADGTVSLPVVPAKVTGVQVNDGTSAQRSRVTSLTVTFDSIVSLPPSPEAAFQLVRASDSAAVSLLASVDNFSGPGTVVTLSFLGGAVDANSLADGFFNLTVLASQVNNGGLDGNGDGTLGDNHNRNGTAGNGLFRLFGDANGDANVDGAIDFPAFGAEFNATGTNLAFDFNNDGIVEGAVDFPAFGANFNSSL